MLSVENLIFTKKKRLHSIGLKEMWREVSKYLSNLLLKVCELLLGYGTTSSVAQALLSDISRNN